MGFVKDVMKVGSIVSSPFGLAGAAINALDGKKKKSLTPPKVPSMISTTYNRPTSMIGSQRGGY